MADFRTRTNRQQLQDYSDDKQRKLEIAQAGLALKEQTAVDQLDLDKRRLKVDESELEIKQLGFLAKRKEQLNTEQQSRSFFTAIADLSPEDPDFDGHMSVLIAAHPYAMMNPQTKEWVSSKTALAKIASESRIKAAQAYGIDPAEFVEKDPQTGRFKRYNWGAYGKAITAKRNEQTTERTKFATTLAPGSSIKVVDDGDKAVVTADVVSEAEKLRQGAGALKPDVAAGLMHKAGGSQADVAIAKGTAEQAAARNAQRDADAKLKTVVARITALKATGGGALSTETVAELEALAKQLETPADDTEDTRPSWKKTLGVK